jgi:uncharacterized protein YndB with AHSA1/START domain
MTVLEHQLERTVLIRAPRETVFRFFTDPARWAAWWGAGSTIEPRSSGRVHIRYPDGTEAGGEIIELDPPARIVFTYGYASGKQIAPGGSRVTIRLDPVDEGTRLVLTHDFADPAARDHHVQGWRYQLSLFSNLVANEVLGDPAALVDGWFDVWVLTDDAARRSALDRIAAPAIEFRDRFSAIIGVDELTAHIGAALRFMPGFTLRRNGPVRHCQGTLLADWTTTGPDGAPRGAGTNVFVLGPGGRITSVVGFWSQ